MHSLSKVMFHLTAAPHAMQHRSVNSETWVPRCCFQAGRLKTRTPFEIHFPHRSWPCQLITQQAFTISMCFNFIIQTLTSNSNTLQCLCSFRVLKSQNFTCTLGMYKCVWCKFHHQLRIRQARIKSQISLFHQNGLCSGARAYSRPGELELVTNRLCVSTALRNERWCNAVTCCYNQSKIKQHVSWCLCRQYLFCCSLYQK